MSEKKPSIGNSKSTRNNERDSIEKKTQSEKRPEYKRQTTKTRRLEEQKQREQEQKEIRDRRCLQIERKVVAVSFGVGLFSSFLFLIAVSTNHWVNVIHTDPLSKNKTHSDGHYYESGHYFGLWKRCDHMYSNLPPRQEEYHHKCQPMHEYQSPDKDTNDGIMHFRRSCCALGIIGLIISVFAQFATFYSISRHRYIYKRLAGVLDLITAAACLVTMELFNQLLNFEKDNMRQEIPEDSIVRYDFSYCFGWISFALFLIEGIVVLVCSRKRKGGRARSNSEAVSNEPVNLGRI